MSDSRPAPNPMLYVLDRFLSRDELIACLAETPAKLRALFAGASDAAVSTAPAPGEWSAFQLLCHMRDAAIVYTARFRWMAYDDDPLLPNFDQDAWVDRSQDTVADIEPILDYVAATRIDMIRVLSRMPDSAWSRTGRHATAGTIVLEDYVRHQLAHEEGHFEDIRVALEG